MGKADDLENWSICFIFTRNCYILGMTFSSREEIIYYDV